MDRKDPDCVLVSPNRFAHKHCAEIEDKRELTDSEKLDRYIMELYELDYVPPGIRRQINSFVKDYNFTISGIHKSLIYFYKIKHNPVDKSKGIGIVPYIYRDSYNYFYSLWLAHQKNETKVIEEYVPEVEEIHIKDPKQKIKPKRQLFTFLDEE
jgi:hypothetical protein